MGYFRGEVVLACRRCDRVHLMVTPARAPRALVGLRHPDATIAMDDALVERYLVCLVCGQRQGTRSVDLVLVGGRPMTVARCPRVTGRIGRARRCSPGWPSGG